MLGRIFGKKENAETSKLTKFNTLCDISKNESNHYGHIYVRLTTLLSSITGISTLEYDPKERKLIHPIDLTLYAMYQNQLIQAAFLSRCAYMPTTLFMKCMRFIDDLDIQNDVITVMERYHYLRYNFKDLFIASAPTAESSSLSEPHGAFFPKSGCTVFEYHAPESPIQSKRVVYVVFKGSSSIRDFKSDFTPGKLPLANIPTLSDMSGTVYPGFYQHMESEVEDILKTVEKYSAKAEAVYVTGHSLGGAMATLFSMILANAREKGAAIPVINTITFGAPNLFSDEARIEFNRFLLIQHTDRAPILTLTRVVSGATNELVNDFIVPLPGVSFSHPGFDVSKVGRYFDNTFKKSGRTPDIARQRKLFIGADNPTTKLSAFIKSEQRLMDPNFLQNVLGPDAKITRNDLITPDVEAAEAAADQKDININVKELASNAKKAEAEEDKREEGITVGGGFSFAFTPSGISYKKCAEKMFPNVVKIKCGSGFCHGIYAGIGFMGALRFPPGIVTKDPSTGKLEFKAIAKKEPTHKTILMGTATQLNGQYTPILPKNGGATRYRRSTVKRKSRRTRKHYSTRSIARR